MQHNNSSGNNILCSPRFLSVRNKSYWKYKEYRSYNNLSWTYVSFVIFNKSMLLKFEAFLKQKFQICQYKQNYSKCLYLHINRYNVVFIVKIPFKRFGYVLIFLTLTHSHPHTPTHLSVNVLRHLFINKWFLYFYNLTKSFNF